RYLFSSYYFRSSLFFLFCTIRPPPRPPLFPYTTLFRSRAGRRIALLFFWSQPGCLHIPSSVTKNLFTTKWLISADKSAIFTVIQDRKSTRLNSSHSQISYAVFCLKKKTKHKHDIYHSPT